MDAGLASDQESLYARLGADEGIARLLRHFYADVRQHKVIGPVFNARIQNWPEHLEKIGRFWAQVTGGPMNYEGQMPVRHFDLGLSSSDFAAWLQLWEINCQLWLPPPEAKELIALAHQIGARLRSLVAKP